MLLTHEIIEVMNFYIHACVHEICKVKYDDDLLPGVLQANTESRVEAQKVPEWTIHFRNGFRPVRYQGDIKFFRNAIDILHISLRTYRSEGHRCPKFKGCTAYEEMTPPPLILQNAINRFKNMEKVALSGKLWNSVRQFWLNNEAWNLESCRSLMIVIDDRGSEYWRMKTESGNHKWKKTGMRGLEWEDNVAASSRGEFPDVVYNTEYARYLEKGWKHQQSLLQSKYQRHPNLSWLAGVANAEFKVVSGPYYRKTLTETTWTD